MAGKQKRKNKKKKDPQAVAIAVVIAAIAAFAVFCVAGAFVFFSAVLDRNSVFAKNDSAIQASDEETAASQFSGADGSKSNNDWFAKKAEEVFAESDDGLKLHGYLINNKKAKGKYAVVFHGYSSEASHMAGYAKRFYNMGYSVLAPDARAHGASEGSIRTMGWLDRKDALVWINSLVEKNQNCEIVLFGVSMGGATVMMTAGEELPAQVIAAIEDCGYTSVWDELEYQLTAKYHLLSFPLLDIANVIAKTRGGYDFKEASAIEQVQKSRIPILFIHGKNDSFVPFEMLDKVYDAAQCNKRKLIIDNAEHAQSGSVDPTLYWNTIKEFLSQL